MPHDRVADFAHGSLERIAERSVDVAHAQRHGDIVNALDSEMHVPLQGPLRPQKRLGLGDDGCQIRKPLASAAGARLGTRSLATGCSAGSIGRPTGRGSDS